MRREKEIELPKNTRGAHQANHRNETNIFPDVAVHFTVGDADRDVVINGTGSVRRQESH